ncbi:MAG: hypothetical protein AAFN77_23285 [Planctomycetota bacterium]
MEPPRFQFATRRILLAIVGTCVAILLLQMYLARAEFAKVKAETAQKLASGGWGSTSHQSLLETLNQITYQNQHIPTLAFASVNESFIEIKEVRNGEAISSNGRLNVGWFESENSIDSIRISLKNDDEVNYPLQDRLHRMDLYHHSTFTLGELGLKSHREIESIALMSEGKAITQPILPTYVPAQSAAAK